MEGTRKRLFIVCVLMKYVDQLVIVTVNDNNHCDSGNDNDDDDDCEGALEQDIIDPNSTDHRRSQSSGCSRSYPVSCRMSYRRLDYFSLSFCNHFSYLANLSYLMISK
ncbi:hypothetical protein LOAG_01857 [Loa loa]|uniref:Uncharacterized protein n=1 Tax=Loa loa TaxID=7209 RepID=A0A1S0UA03_LOALO|nr:hypothetical protein LOAG_01857 [Loa loa]EFO26633.1 hypothetical protein LOAG_01857 [Loa loa]